MKEEGPPLLPVARALRSAGAEIHVYRRARDAWWLPAPDLLVANSAAAARRLRWLALRHGCPLVLYGAAEANDVPGVSRAVVFDASAADRLRSCAPAPERVHLLPEGPAALQQHVELLLEIAQERAPASLGKRAARQAVARVGRVAGRLLRPPALALAYHQVQKEMRGFDPYMAVNRSTLERQVRALLRRGYAGVTMADHAARRRDRPTFAISFDDGYADTLEIAAPVLLGLQVPFTVYVITDVVAGRLRAPWYEIAAQAVLCREARPRTLPLLRAHADLTSVLDAGPAAPPLARELVERLKRWPPRRRDVLIEELGAAGAEALLAQVPRYLDRRGGRGAARRRRRDLVPYRDPPDPALAR